MSAAVTAYMVGPADLSDSSRYVSIWDVPVFDVHRHRRKGDIDGRTLRLICRNTDDRCGRGDYPPLVLGHTFDGEGDEHRQPLPVGFASAFHIAPYSGRDCIHCTFHLDREHYDACRSYPFRSVERISSASDPAWNFLERIALLRRQPDRDLGVLRLPPLSRGQAQPLGIDSPAGAAPASASASGA